MIVKTRVNLAAIVTLPFLHQALLPHRLIAPSILLTSLLRQKEPMASRMEGKGMKEHRISQRNTQHSLTAILVAITSPTATLTLMAATNSPGASGGDLHRQTIPRDV